LNLCENLFKMAISNGRSWLLSSIAFMSSGSQLVHPASNHRYVTKSK
jgi:hypothetical protein